MSYSELYLGGSGPLISNPAHSSNGYNPKACIFGVPFDATHSYRPGCRFGPDAIRSAFHNIEVFHPELGVDLEDTELLDMGNTPHTASASHMLDVSGRVTGDLLKRGLPIFALGGEHLLTYGTYTAFPPDVAYVVFDAHYDLRDAYGDVSLNHATYLRRIVEQICGKRDDACRPGNPEDGSHGMEPAGGVPDPGILHVGARAFAAEELAFLNDNRGLVSTITDADIRDGRGPEILRDFASTHDKLYISYDLDVLDPAFAPGVGNPEACGITSRDLFDMVLAIADTGTKIAGSDIVELNPAYDTGATSALAAKLLSTTIAISIL